METKSRSLIVEMPDKKLVDVEYYFADNSLKANDPFAQLFIQLDKGICIMKIERSIIYNPKEVERIVQNKVINEQGHLW